jgi:hypothetical protein
MTEIWLHGVADAVAAEVCLRTGLEVLGNHISAMKSGQAKFNPCGT